MTPAASEQSIPRATEWPPGMRAQRWMRGGNLALAQGVVLTKLDDTSGMSSYVCETHANGERILNLLHQCLIEIAELPVGWRKFRSEVPSGPIGLFA